MHQRLVLPPRTMDVKGQIESARSRTQCPSRYKPYLITIGAVFLLFHWVLVREYLGLLRPRTVMYMKALREEEKVFINLSFGKRSI